MDRSICSRQFHRRHRRRPASLPCCLQTVVKSWRPMSVRCAGPVFGMPPTWAAIWPPIPMSTTMLFRSVGMWHFRRAQRNCAKNIRRWFKATSRQQFRQRRRAEDRRQDVSAATATPHFRTGRGCAATRAPAARRSLSSAASARGPLGFCARWSGTTGSTGPWLR